MMEINDNKTFVLLINEFVLSMRRLSEVRCLRVFKEKHRITERIGIS